MQTVAAYKQIHGPSWMASFEDWWLLLIAFIVWIGCISTSCIHDNSP